MQAEPESAPQGPPPEPDPSLDLAVELQQQIFDFELRLDRVGYHEILGVERGADARKIKRAYFQLSKQYHPDRYFRRNIGDHAQRLDRIFKRVSEAYELLSDPTTRSEIERSMAAARPSPSAVEEADAAASPGYRAPTRMENLARLRRSFGGASEKVLAERRYRASQFYDAAQRASSEKRWLEAAASVRLAIAFDPWNPDYKTGFASIQAEVSAMRALELIESSESDIDPAEALEAVEEVLAYRPNDVELQVRAATLALGEGMVEEATDYTDRLCELEPEVATHHLLRARVQRRAGLASEAVRSIDKAARLAPKDPEIEAERRRLKKAR